MTLGREVFIKTSLAKLDFPSRAVLADPSSFLAKRLLESMTETLGAVSDPPFRNAGQVEDAALLYSLTMATVLGSRSTFHPPAF